MTAATTTTSELAPPIKPPTYVLPDYAYPAWDRMAIDQGVPYLLGALVSALQPRIVVEAGTYKGHAALSIASTLKAIKRGHLHTADPIEQNVTALFQKNDLTEYATYHLATYEDMLERVAPYGGVDLAFVDASGSPEDRTMRMRHPNHDETALVAEALAAHARLTGSQQASTSPGQPMDSMAPF